MFSLFDSSNWQDMNSRVNPSLMRSGQGIILGFMIFCLFSCVAQTKSSSRHKEDDVEDPEETAEPGEGTDNDESDESDTETTTYTVGASTGFTSSIGYGAKTTPTSSATNTYYVDSATGNDANNGTAENLAWATVQHAADTLTAGERVLIKNGTYRELVTPANGGTSCNPITYEAFPGHTPVISGADLVSASNFVALSELESFGTTPLFSEDFEGGTTGNFNSVTADGSNTVTVPTTLPFKGQYSMKATFDGTNENARVNKTVTTSADVYARVYFYLDPAFDITAATSRCDLLLMRLDSSTTRARVSIYKTGGGAFYLRADLVTPSVATIYDGTANAGEIVTGQWYYMQLRYKGNDGATGGGAFWLDGTLKGSDFTRDTSGLSVGRIELGGNTSGIAQASSGAAAYFDNLTVSTSAPGAFVSAAPTVVFANGFETGDTTSYSSTSVDGSNTLTVETTGPHAGTYAAKAAFGGTNASAALNRDFASRDDTFARGYFKLSSNFDLNDANSRFDLLLLRNSTTATRARVAIGKDALGRFFLQGDIVTPAAATFYTGYGGEIRKDQWHSVELRYKGGDATTGGAEIWLDGRWLAKKYDVNTSGLASSRIEFGGNSSSATFPTSGSSILYDDVYVSSGAIGLVATTGSIGIYRAPMNYDPKIVDVDASPLFLTSSLAQVTNGTFYHDNDNNHLYIRLSDDSSTSGKTIAAGNRDYAVYINGKDYLTFKGITFTNANRSGRGSIQAESADYINIYDCRFLRNYQMGVLLQRTNNSELSNNEFIDNSEEFGGGIRLEFSNDVLIEYNTITGSRSSGIMIKGFVNAVTEPSDRITIRRNKIYDIVDAGIYLSYNVGSSTVYENLIYNVRQSTYLTGQNSGGNGIHAALNSNLNIVYDNILYNLDTHGISFRGDAANNTAYNNTIYNAGMKGSGAGLDIHSSSALDPTNNSVYNNIVYQSMTACVSVDAITQGNTSDYNLCYNPGLPYGKWGSTDYATLASFQNASGEDAHSVNADPSFVDLSNLNFALSSSSPGATAGKSRP